MEEFKSIAYSIYLWLESTLFGAVPLNDWYTTNRDTIIGISIVVVCVIVFFIALGLVIGVIRFLARCANVRL